MPLARTFHTREGGAPACCRLTAFEWFKPATCRRSGLSVFCAGHKLSGLGFEARSHACQRRFGRQRQSGGPVPPHPSPLPRGEGATLAALRACGCAQLYESRAWHLPLPWERAGVRGNWAHAVSTVPAALSLTPSSSEVGLAVFCAPVIRKAQFRAVAARRELRGLPAV